VRRDVAPDDERLGEVVQTIVGAKPKAALERELADHLV